MQLCLFLLYRVSKALIHLINDYTLDDIQKAAVANFYTFCLGNISSFLFHFYVHPVMRFQTMFYMFAYK